MLRFAVFDDFVPASAFPLRHACLLDKDNAALPSEIAFKAGVIECLKPTTDAVALALQYDAERCGRLTLQTTLLPDNELPYLLDIELARHRIAVLINATFETSSVTHTLPDDHPLFEQVDQAIDLFTDALGEPSASFGRYTPQQAAIARRALILAIEASETLALIQARHQLEERYAGAERAKAGAGEDPAAGPTLAEIIPPVGCAVDNVIFAPALQKIITDSFDFIISPMRWNEIEPEEGRYDFRRTDLWIRWAVDQAKRAVVSGPLIDLSPRALPEWLLIWTHDYETLREFAFEHVTRVVKRYKKAVSRWTIVSAPSLGDGVDLTLDQWVDLTRLAALAVRRHAPAGARLTVELPHPFPRHPGGNTPGVMPRLFADMLIHAGVQADAYAIRMQMGDLVVGRDTRDLMQIATVLDAFSTLERPIHISAFGAPSEPVAETTESQCPGAWREPWSPDQQAEWLACVMAIAASRPYVASICWQALYDAPGAPEMASGGLISAAGRAKPALARITEFTRALRARTIPSILTNTDGAPASRGANAVAP
jgi:hypothetical protein